jgi:hypothetical protein
MCAEAGPAARSRSRPDETFARHHPAGRVLCCLDGPVCEMTDSLGIHKLPPLADGDLVAIEQAGAYAASFTSRYNGRPHPAEALLWPGDELKLCERPAVEAAPGWLAERLPPAERSLV